MVDIDQLSEKPADLGLSCFENDLSRLSMVRPNKKILCLG